MIARVEKSFYGAQALLELVSDTEPFSDSSASSDHISSHASSVTNGANHPTPRGLSHAPARATDADRSDTDSEPVRRQGAKTKKRRRDSSTNSDLTNKSVTAGSKRRKTSEAYRNKLYRKAIEQESADERAAAENKKKNKKTGDKGTGRSPEERSMTF
jgi:hypothetical protein